MDVGREEGREVGWMDGWTVGRTDAQTDRHLTHQLKCNCITLLNLYMHGKGDMEIMNGREE